MPGTGTILCFGDSNVQAGVVVQKLELLGYTGVGSQENPAGVFHNGYTPSRNAWDMIQNAGFPVHPTQPDGFLLDPAFAVPPDYVVVAFGTNWLRLWASGNGSEVMPVALPASHNGALTRYFKNLWPNAFVISTIYVNGIDDPGHADWTVYEGAPYNAGVGNGQAYWDSKRLEFIAEFEPYHAGDADAHVRFDLDRDNHFSDSVHMTDAGATAWAALVDQAINGQAAFVFPTIVEPNKCTIYAQTRDFVGAEVAGAKIRITGPSGGFFHGNLHVAETLESAESGADGRVTFEVYETETIHQGVIVEFLIGTQTLSRIASIPDQTSINLKDLLT